MLEDRRFEYFVSGLKLRSSFQVKHKTSSRHGNCLQPDRFFFIERICSNSYYFVEKRTKRDSYKFSGDSNQPPIEYVYTYSEETPKRSSDPDDEKTSVRFHTAWLLFWLTYKLFDDGFCLIRLTWFLSTATVQGRLSALWVRTGI